MKKIVMTIAWLLAWTPAAFAQTAYLESVKMENNRVEKVGADVRVQMDLVFDGLDLKKQHSLQLVPVIVSADGTREQALQPVQVDGRIRNKVLKRREALGEAIPAEGTRLLRDNGSTQSIHYEATAPYDPWMLNGRLELRADVTGCADCNEGHETLAAGSILPYAEPVMAMAARMQPKEETVKRRAEVRTARLQYGQGSHRILSDYKGNRAELDKVRASIDMVKENRDLTITGIFITGYASPESSMAFNQALSERRAQALADYIARQYPDLDKSLWHVKGHGEDWEGLRREVEKRPGLLKQAEVLRIIDECGDDRDACEARFKALNPPEIYQRLLNEMYGPLRRNEYRIEYNVRHYNQEEARQLLKTRPDLLSVAEIHRVADSYGRGTEDYLRALKTAVDTWPEDKAALNNYALALLDAGRYDAVVALLQQRAGQDGSLINLMGVAYYKAGRLDEAQEAFQKAADAGCADARSNLSQLVQARAMLGK